MLRDRLKNFSSDNTHFKGLIEILERVRIEVSIIFTVGIQLKSHLSNNENITCVRINEILSTVCATIPQRLYSTLSMYARDNCVWAGITCKLITVLNALGPALLFADSRDCGQECSTGTVKVVISACIHFCG